MPRKRIFRAAAAVAAVAAAALVLSACSKVEEGGDAAESAFPQMDIRLIIQANPGGGSDLSSRALAAELEGILGVSVIAENMPGAAGALGRASGALTRRLVSPLGFAPGADQIEGITRGGRCGGGGTA